MPVNPKLLIYSCPPSLFGKHKLRVFFFFLICLWVHFCFIDKFICAIFLIPYVSNVIFCLSLSGLLQLIWSCLGWSKLVQIASSHSFLWLSNIPSYIRTTFCLSTDLSAYLGCLHVLAIVNSAAVNIEVHISLVFSGCMPRSWLAGS